MLGPWHLFPPENVSFIPASPGIYAVADQEDHILAIAAALNLREALQELAEFIPLPLRDLATHFCVEAHPEPNRRRAELVANVLARTGAFPPCNRRHPHFPARLPVWIQHPGGEAGLQRLAAETVNVSHAGLRLALPEAPAPGTVLDLQVETPFGLVETEGRIAWTEVRPPHTWAGVTLLRLQTAQDALRWERFIGSLVERIIHG
jgi:hypothetical protein